MSVPTLYLDVCYAGCRRPTIGWAKIHVELATQHMWRRYCLYHLKQLIMSNNTVELDDIATLAVILEV
jgi:hypothetical protein